MGTGNSLLLGLSFVACLPPTCKTRAKLTACLLLVCCVCCLVLLFVDCLCACLVLFGLCVCVLLVCLCVCVLVSECLRVFVRLFVCFFLSFFLPSFLPSFLSLLVCSFVRLRDPQLFPTLCHSEWNSLSCCRSRHTSVDTLARQHTLQREGKSSHHDIPRFKGGIWWPSRGLFAFTNGFCTRAGQMGFCCFEGRSTPTNHPYTRCSAFWSFGAWVVPKEGYELVAPDGKSVDVVISTAHLPGEHKGG